MSEELLFQLETLVVKIRQLEQRVKALELTTVKKPKKEKTE